MSDDLAEADLLLAEAAEAEAPAAQPGAAGAVQVLSAAGARPATGTTPAARAAPAAGAAGSADTTEADTTEADADAGQAKDAAQAEDTAPAREDSAPDKDMAPASPPARPAEAGGTSARAQAGNAPHGSAPAAPAREGTTPPAGEPSGPGETASTGTAEEATAAPAGAPPRQGQPGSPPPPSEAAAPEPVAAPREEGAKAKRRISRRTLIQAGLIGGAGAGALPLLALVGSIAPSNVPQPTNLTFSLNSNWLFGGQYMAGSESSFYNDSGFAPVTLPHTVTPLSWRNWNAEAWQQMWIYRRRFSGAALVSSRRPGNRIMVDFDGVMVNATVVINDETVSHPPGRVPAVLGRADRPRQPRATICCRSWWTPTACRCRR